MGDAEKNSPQTSRAGFVVVGLSHHTAPVDVREQLAFTDEQLAGALQRATAFGGGGQGEAMIVSTCNRVELYFAGGSELSLDADRAPSLRVSMLDQVARFLSDERGLSSPPATIANHLYAHTGEAAMKHLFRVAASLDSAVVGESQILGQLKDAYELARQVGTIGQLLGQIVPRAFSAAKRVRTETGIARSSSSVASAAVGLARRIFGDLRGHEVLIIGAGKMGELAAKHLVAAGSGTLLVVNRTHERGEALAARLRDAGARAESHPWESLPSLLARADLVLSSTGAAEPVLTRDMVHKAMKTRRGRWLCLLDIAVPRDVEPATGDLDNVYLYDVDALTRLVDDNLTERSREAELAERIVVEEVARCVVGLKALGVVPTIRALRERFAAVAQGEAQRMLGKMPGATDEERREVQLLADAIVNKLLHAPLTALKREAESEALVAAVHTLFDLGESSNLTEIVPVHTSPTRLATPHANAGGSDDKKR